MGKGNSGTLSGVMIGHWSLMSETSLLLIGLGQIDDGEGKRLAMALSVHCSSAIHSALFLSVRAVCCP